MNSKVIIYDDNCPLCSAYTSAFVKTGLISKEGRRNFSGIDETLVNQIDLRRSVNEIPLIDTATHQVWYGIDALLEILQQKMPVVKTIGNNRCVKWGLQKLYKFISYNRRVIVASSNEKNGFDCSPDFNVRYRLVFLFVFLIFNTLMLFPLQEYVLHKSIFNSTILGLQMSHTIFVCINISIGLLLGKKNGLEYLGQINMTALTAIMLCIPLIFLNRYIGLKASFNTYYLGMVTIVVLHEYLRRMRYIGFVKSRKPVLVVNIGCFAFFLAYLMTF